MNSLRIIHVIFIIAVITGCNGSSDYTGNGIVSFDEKAVYQMETIDEHSAPARAQPTAEATDRKLITEGRLEFETVSIRSTRENVFDAVARHRGYVSSDQEYQSPGRRSNTVVIRVPAEQFDSLMHEATAGVSRFDYKDVNSRDVTEEFVDIQARLNTKKQLEARYLELLSKASSVSDILQIERQIGQLRSEIESIEGRLNFLDNRAAFSTLTMTFYENIPRAIAFGQKFRIGFRNGWDNLIWFFVILTNIWPFILIGTGMFFGIRGYRRKRATVL